MNVIHAYTRNLTCLIFRVPKSSNGFVQKLRTKSPTCHLFGSTKRGTLEFLDDFPAIKIGMISQNSFGNLFANKLLLSLWIVLLLLPLSSQKFPYLPVVRNFFSREWWWLSLPIGPMDHARENGARETPRCWQRSCHSLVPKRLTLFNGKRMWNIGSGTKTEPWHFTPLQSGGNYIICDMYSVYITWFQ